MTLIAFSVAFMLVIQVALWFAIKRFRRVPDDTVSLPKSDAYREAAWWLAATVIVLILLGVLINRIYRAQRTPTGVMLAMRSSATI